MLRFDNNYKEPCQLRQGSFTRILYENDKIWVFVIIVI